MSKNNGIDKKQKVLFSQVEINKMLESVPSNIRSYIDSLQNQISNMSAIGLALSKERDMDKLLEMILLEAKRIFIPDSFDFIIKSIGVFSNKELIIKACDIILDSLDYIEKNLNNNEVVKISSSISRIDNAYDIILHNYDYTIGKILEYYLYNLRLHVV